VDFEATGKLLIIYSPFVKYLRKMGINEAVLQFFIDFKKAYDSVRREVLYNIPIEVGIPTKEAGVIKVCLQESPHSKHLFGMFPIINGFKQEDVLLLLFCNFAVQ
jgi:hypothetical protein